MTWSHIRLMISLGKMAIESLGVGGGSEASEFVDACCSVTMLGSGGMLNVDIVMEF